MLSNGINWFLRSVLLVRFPTRWLTAPAPALPLSPRGSRNTPFSSRLYHSTKPSRSHARIFNRSPRRERNTNRCPLSGFSPITACTRSASRSNPQRMSVASTASQMRAACAPSSARKLGSPITPLPPRPPAPALARRHSLAPPPGSARSATVSPPARHRTRAALAHGPPPRTRSRPARRGGPAALPRTCLRRHASPLLRHCACSLAKPPPAAASSTSKSAARTTDAPGRTPPHSARSAPARQPASATSLAPSCSVLAASLCLPPRHPAQCSTPPRPHKMPFTYRSQNKETRSNTHANEYAGGSFVCLHRVYRKAYAARSCSRCCRTLQIRELAQSFERDRLQLRPHRAARAAQAKPTNPDQGRARTHGLGPEPLQQRSTRLCRISRSARWLL